ncbi:MAG: hypothetical protein OXC40_03695 [Proteobacteria bacterium]|nr:hypothetical protein [Pseudomonadota bacterium]
MTSQAFARTPTVTFPTLDDINEFDEYDDEELERYWRLLDNLLIDEGLPTALLEQLSGDEKLILLEEILS